MSRARAYAASAARSESKTAPREIVDALQRDLARVAFVLTGDSETTLTLARTAFLEVLTGPVDWEIEPAVWTRLLTALGGCYLSTVRAATQPAEELEVDPAPGHDEQARLRVTLVLHDLGGLNDLDAARISGFEAGEFEPASSTPRPAIRCLNASHWSRGCLKRCGSR